MSAPYWYQPANQYGGLPPQPVPPPHSQGPPPGQTVNPPNYGWNGFHQPYGQPCPPQPQPQAPPMVVQYQPTESYYPPVYGQPHALPPRPVPQPVQPVPQPVQPVPQPVQPVPQPVQAVPQTGPQPVPQPISQSGAPPAPQPASQPVPQGVSQPLPTGYSISQPANSWGQPQVQETLQHSWNQPQVHITPSQPQQYQPPQQYPSQQSIPQPQQQHPQSVPQPQQQQQYQEPQQQQYQQQQYQQPQQQPSAPQPQQYGQAPWATTSQFPFPDRYQRPDNQVQSQVPFQIPVSGQLPVPGQVPGQGQNSAPSQIPATNEPPPPPDHLANPNNVVPATEDRSLKRGIPLSNESTYDYGADFKRQREHSYPIATADIPLPPKESSPIENSHLSNAQQYPQDQHQQQHQQIVGQNHSQNNGTMNSQPEETTINETIPIPEHLKQKIPTLGTSVGAPVVYSQSPASNQHESHQIIHQNGNSQPANPDQHHQNSYQNPQNSTQLQKNNQHPSQNEPQSQYNLQDNNIYSLANQYNTVCMQRTENFFDDCSPNKAPPRPSKPPNARKFNWEDGAGSKFFCDMCQVECSTEPDFVQHFSGKKHSKTQTQLKKIDETLLEVLAMKTYDLNNVYNLKCNICAQVLPTVDVFQQHMLGFKHKFSVGSMIAKGAKVPDIEPTFECNDLDQTKMSEIIAKLKQYDEKIKKGVEAAIVVEKPSPSKKTPVKKGASALPELLGGKFVIKHPIIGMLWYCKLCKVDLSPSQSVQIEHCRGKQHRGNFIWKINNSDVGVLTMVNAEGIPLVRRTNFEEDRKHYSADPNTLIPFEAFRDHPFVPHPVINQQIFTANKTICRLTEFSADDKKLEKKSSEITNGKSSIAELYELVKYISKVAYKITYAINELLLEFKPNESAEVRFRKSFDTANCKIAKGVFTKQLDNLPKNHSCYFTTVVRTDIIGKGYILNQEDKLDLVMVCDFLLTAEVLKLYEIGFVHLLNMDEDRGRTINVYPSIDMSSLSICYLSDDLCPIIEINLKLTTKLYRNKDRIQIIRDVPTILNVDQGLEFLSEIRQMRWFKEKHIYYPYFMFVIRILRDFRRRNPVWSKVTLYSMELVLDHLLRNCKTFLSPAILIQNFFHFFASVKLNTQTLFGDVCEADYCNPFKHLSDDECGRIQSSAINAVNRIKMHKLEQVLYTPMPVDENHVAKDTIVESMPSSNNGNNENDEWNNVKVEAMHENQSTIRDNNDVEARFSDDHEDEDSS